MIPLKITEEMKKRLLDQFMEKLNALKDGEASVKIEQTLSEKALDRPSVVFSERAFIKMLSLVLNYNTEIAWHGTVEREDDLTFRITDILVYPQVVSGATVRTDDKEYADWLNEQPDEIFEKIRFQGHSHVRMQVTPSGTDLDSQAAIVRQLTGDDYYIFSIINKDLKINTWIYDMKNNAKYDPEDINVFFCSPEIYTELLDMKALCAKTVRDTATSWKTAAASKAAASSDKDEKKDAKKDEKPKAAKAKKPKEAKKKTSGTLVPYPLDDDDDDEDASWSAYADSYYGNYYGAYPYKPLYPQLNNARKDYPYDY